MSLAERISKIQLDQEQTKKQFMSEVFQGLQQINAYKTAEEVEAKRLFERKEEIDRTTITGTETFKTDLGETKTTTFGSGRERKDVVTDERKLTETFKTYKLGNKIISVDETGKVNVLATGDDGADLSFTQKKQITNITEQIDKSESLILGIEGKLDNFNSIIEEAETIASEKGKELKGRKKVQILVKGEFIDVKVSDLRKRIKLAEAGITREQGNIKKFNEKLKKMGVIETTVEEKTIVRTGISNGKKVIEYSDGSIEYAD